MEAEALEPDSGGDDVLDQQFRLGRVDTELRRQVRLRGRIRERQPHQDPDVGRPAHELLRLDGVVDDERPDPPSNGNKKFGPEEPVAVEAGNGTRVLGCE